MSESRNNSWNLSLFYYREYWPRLFRFLNEQLRFHRQQSAQSITALIYLNFERGDNIRITLKGAANQLQSHGRSFVLSAQQFLASCPSRTDTVANAGSVFFMDCPNNTLWHSLFVASQPKQVHEQSLELLMSELICLYFSSHQFAHGSIRHFIRCIQEATIRAWTEATSHGVLQLLSYLDSFHAQGIAFGKTDPSHVPFSCTTIEEFSVDWESEDTLALADFTGALDKWKQAIAFHAQGGVISPEQYYLSLKVMNKHLGNRTGNLLHGVLSRIRHV